MTPLRTAPAGLAGEERMLRAFPARSVVAQRAEGAHLWDPEGRRFLDLGGASQGVAVVGHNHPEVVAAVRDQAGTLLHVAQGFPSPARAGFLERLHRRLPPALGRTFLANSGTEANELAMKLAVAATRRRCFTAATGAFHGRTLGALSLTHRPAFRAPFSGVLADVDFAPYNDEEALKAHVGPETAALVLEPVQGEGGVRRATPAYLRAARDLCDDHGALLVFDEVQSGLDRTGSFLACAHAGVTPDIVTLGKGLAGGLPIGAACVTDAVAEALPPGGHGSTYGGAPLACAAGSAVLDVLERDALGARAVEVGDRLARAIEALEHPLVRGVHGQGMMLGVDLRIRPAPVLRGLEEAGVLALSAGTTQVRLLPPLVTAWPDLEDAVEALRAALDAVRP